MACTTYYIFEIILELEMIRDFTAFCKGFYNKANWGKLPLTFQGALDL